MLADTMPRAGLAQGTRAVSLIAAICALALFAAGAGLAAAWLTDAAHRTNAFTLEVEETPIEEPYAALYVIPGTTDRALVFDRGDEVPAEWEGRQIEASWRGMESGSGDFAIARTRPWERYAYTITQVASGAAAKRHPIGVLDMERWFYGMYGMTAADVSGITPNAFAEGSRTPSTSIERVFSGCTGIMGITGLEEWDTAGLTMAEYAFSDCYMLSRLDLSAWNVTSVTSISGLCRGSACLEEVDISGWDLPVCERLYEAFAGCTALKQVQGLNSLSVPRASLLANLFRGCASMERIVLGELGTDLERPTELTTDMFCGCTSLRYLDISHAQFTETSGGEGLLAHVDGLETLIASNAIMLKNGPALGQPSISSASFAAPYWRCEETGEGLDERQMVRFLERSYSPTGPRQVLTFHRIMASAAPDAPYAALYERTDGMRTLIIDKGAAAPASYEGMSLIQEFRGICENPERCAAEWRQSNIAKVSILSALSPRSCAGWFAEMAVPEGIAGLELLDMSGCQDVTDMFASSGAATLAVEGWELSARADGFSLLFDSCYNLRKLDTSKWTAENALYLSGACSLNELRVNPTCSVGNIAETTSADDTRFFDGYWYLEGTGDPLTSFDVEMVVWHARYENVVLTFTHEKADRSYAALYGSPGNASLVFGRGVDVPSAYGGASLMAAYRGLEETAYAQRDWMSFHGGASPWTSFASSITTVACTDDALRSPIRISGASGWFAGCTSLTSVNGAGWDLSTATALKSAFDGCSSLSLITGAETWNTSKVKDMNATFRGCSVLTLDCSGWKTSSVQDHGSFSAGAEGVVSPFPDDPASKMEEASEEDAGEPDEPEVPESITSDSDESVVEETKDNAEEPVEDESPVPVDPSLEDADGTTSEVSGAGEAAVAKEALSA